MSVSRLSDLTCPLRLYLRVRQLYYSVSAMLENLLQKLPLKYSAYTVLQTGSSSTKTMEFLVSVSLES